VPALAVADAFVEAFDHQASDALGAMPDHQGEVNQPERKADLVFPADVVRQDASN
jgi:hypothetical protein